MSPSPPLVIAQQDPALSVVVLSTTLLHYSEGADPALDRPAHVRAGSGLAQVGSDLALIQDDANFLALIAPGSGKVRAITLPTGAGGVRLFDKGRGNKKEKLDLEAVVAVGQGNDTTLLAFGSGSTGQREQVLMVRRWERGEPEVQLVDAGSLYFELRELPGYAPGRLNIEGAVLLEDQVRLFTRGNGKLRHGASPVDATCDLALDELLTYLHAPDRSPAPRPSNVVQYDLGTLGGVALSFTDATRWGDRVIFSAAAEASPDAVEDGAVTGSALGMIDAGGKARWAPILTSQGRLFEGKVEGVAIADKGKGHLWAVVDPDDPEVASLLVRLEVRGRS